MKIRAFICLATPMLLGACFGDSQSLTDDGRGYPELSLEFAEATTAGSTETATLTITNPGPGAMDSLVIAFSRLGDPALPLPIVDVAPADDEGAVQDVTPEPTAVSPDGVIYTFDGIAVGETLTIEFELTIPRADGPAGNAILVYEGRDPDRARGVRLETEVGVSL